MSAAERKHFMSNAHKVAMGDFPRDHLTCKEKTGVMRPGKTAKDKARLSRRSETPAAPVKAAPAKKRK